MEPLPPVVDAVVVGGGPAGLSAASWLGRHRRSTLVVDAGEQRNRFTDHVHGVLGHEGTSPADLLDAARRDLAAYPHVELRRGRVTGLSGDERGFLVEVDRGRHVLAARLVLATGVRDELPDIPGFAEHYGTDVFHCPSCDGYEARDRDVVVFGWGSHVPAFATHLLDWASSVRIVTHADQSDITPEQRRRLASRDIAVSTGEAAELLGEPGRLEGVRLVDGTHVEASMAFFTIAHHPVAALAAELGCRLDAEGRVVVDDQRMSSVEGVYAAGDLTPGMQLVSVAAAEGAVAGVACATSLHGHRTASNAPAPAPDARPLAPEHVPDA
jgi:thioredoxin reductase